MSSFLRANKTYGQHFLHNIGVIGRIVEAGKIQPGDRVLEIGPGTGMLTRALLEAGTHVTAIEKDPRMLTALAPLQAQYPALTLREGDALSLDLQLLGLEAFHYKVIANIPYYITGHLMRDMLYSWPAPSRAVLMVQAEVASRMSAHEPNMNMLALATQLVSDVETIMKVSPNSFQPPPDVDSAVIALDPRPSDIALRASWEQVLKLAKGAFAQKRKKLSNTIDRELLERAGIDPDLRPQHVSVALWRNLAE